MYCLGIIELTGLMIMEEWIPLTDQCLLG
jgi:hypothetical protein